MKKRILDNSGGQMTMEAVLIMVVLMAVVLMFQKRAQANNYASALTEGPWLPIQGMIEDGVWKAPKTAIAMHPSLIYRHHTALSDDTPQADDSGD